jgi:GT2 family glycosyltransferase
VLATGYLFLLTALSRRRAPPAQEGPPPRFDVVVPAHDEEAGIGRTVRSLLALEWPKDRFRVLVVADNCRDGTAAAAAAAGATVLVRADPARRGKGYALELAFARALADAAADAVVVVDADTVVAPDLLRAFAARLARGAGAIQARYGVLNPEASWRTRLMAIAFATFGDVRALGRERLRLSAGLHGNGMCLPARTLRRVPYRAFSVVEDLEYALDLGEAGVRVEYAPEVAVLGEMASGEAASRSQRVRWEGGRAAVARARALPLLRRAVARRDPVLLDLAIDLVVPPLGRIVGFTAAGAVASALAVALGRAGAVALAPWLLGLALVAAHVLRGVALSGLGLRGLAALSWAPVYLAWKARLVATGTSAPPRDWVRTAREGEGDRDA